MDRGDIQPLRERLAVHVLLILAGLLDMVDHDHLNWFVPVLDLETELLF